MANRCHHGAEEFSMKLGVRKLKLLGVATAAILALSTSGCSSLPTVPDWVDPTTWFGSDDSGADNGQTPDLAGLPDKPAAQTPDEQQKVAESLASDRSNAKYSADALRGGNEPAAAPPPDAAPVVADEPIVAAKPRAGASVPEPVKTASVDRSMAQDPTGNTAPGTLPATVSGAPVMVADTTAAEPVKTAELPAAAPAPAPVKPKKSKPVRVASIPPAAPAPEAAIPVPQTPNALINPSDAELGFKPSSAPPLDPTVSQFVAAPIIDHYRSTAASAGMAMSSNRPTAVVSVAPRRHHVHRRPAATKPAVAMGGPEHMEGKVVANLDVLGSAAEPQPAFANVSGATAIVYFPHDSVGVTAAGRAQVRAAVEQYKAAGGQGFIKVVGHSSSRTANMSAEAHMALIFKKSQDRANAVAREIIRAGVPADKVLVEAVGDTQPVYYESMPKGEDGNRRAEIFVGG
jgi:outer membrane protein OmpA-like peptidoglycan-associated protein